MQFAWGAVVRAKSGQAVSGDCYVTVATPSGGLLAAVIDGLGGGEQAALAADRAATVLRNDPEHPLEQLLPRAHHALQGTRGAVLGVLHFHASAPHVTFCGIGNIGIHVYHEPPIKPISRNGIVGYRMPQPMTLNYQYNSGATFVLFSDGVSSRFALEQHEAPGEDLQHFAEHLLATYGKTSDDATILAIRAYGT